MSWLGRLFGGSPPPPPNSVLIPEDIVARLTKDGAELGTAVIESLRGHFEVLDHPKATIDGVPFWLKREDGSSEIEDELRDRVTLRRAGEEQK